MLEKLMDRPLKVNKNVAGIKRLYIAERGSVDTTFIERKESFFSHFAKFDLRKDTAHYSSQLVYPLNWIGRLLSGGDHPHFRKQIVFNINSSGNDFNIDNLISKDLVIVIEDNNGSYTLIGRRSSANIIGLVYQSGCSMGDFKGYNITISCIERDNVILDWDSLDGFDPKVCILN